LIIQVTRIY